MLQASVCEAYRYFPGVAVDFFGAGVVEVGFDDFLDCRVNSSVFELEGGVTFWFIVVVKFEGEVVVY